MPLKIRTAEAGDAAALTGLVGELGYPTTPEALAARLTELLGRAEDRLLIAEDDRVAGFLHVGLQHSLEDGRYAEIQALIITGSRRGLGYGARLVQAAEAWAREQNVPFIRVRSNVVRERTHTFYKQNGYREAKQQKVFAKRFKDSPRS